MREKLCVVLLAIAGVCSVCSQETWSFNPKRDDFSKDSLLDLRSLNEDEAGATGWVKVTKDGDFSKGDGSPIRFWAVNDGVLRQYPFKKRPHWKERSQDIDHHAKWLAKRGVNMVRLHSHINPDPKTARSLKDVNMGEIEWIWRTVGAMKKEGIYSTVSPYWANTMKSNDRKWGTNWQGKHHALLFFDEKLQDAYKQWLKVLFTTPSKWLNGKTLAKEPALAVFQIQNEDSLLFWTVQGLKGSSKDLFMQKFHDWTVKKYGSINKAYKAWNNEKLKDDNPAGKKLDFIMIWMMTADAKAKGQGHTPRCFDQMQFFTETMYNFNKMIGDYIRKDLKCPVLVNAGNWKVADMVTMNDAERYSYTANDVIAVNRYFGGIHNGPKRGWAIQNGDVYKSDSVLTDKPLGFPITVKQVEGHPMMVTESCWVFPNEFGAEGPLLIAAYSSLTGFDTYYWFAQGTEEWTPPQSANGYMPSQQKWICATPDILGQFPAAALTFRKGYIKRGKPAVVEHRPLESLWKLETPVIAEQAGFDPFRDKGDVAKENGVITNADPFAFFVGPVQVKYDSPASKSKAINLKSYIKVLPDGGRVVQSNTGQLELNTDKGYCTVNAPNVQGVAAHFKKQNEFRLSDVKITSKNDFGSIMVVSLDDRPIKSSGKVLIQLGTQCRPTGWETKPTTIEPKNGKPVKGKKVTDYGKAPWAVETADVEIAIRNRALKEAVVLDANGKPTKTIPLDSISGGKLLRFKGGALYIVLR